MSVCKCQILAGIKLFSSYHTTGNITQVVFNSMVYDIL